MDKRFNEKAGSLFSKIAELSQKDMTEDDIKKIAASTIDVLAEHNLTYDQAYAVLSVMGEALNVRAMMMKV